ncbi:hypothetical protein BC834DRAFT_246828 [Gloeopeniophorella convolvens]|nr:hypothetical protein BC834DRAFT_246828 [Gloeopeniophorella convolvens]
MSSSSIAAGPHTDLVGSDDSNVRNIPGAENATSGHTHVSAKPVQKSPRASQQQHGFAPKHASGDPQPRPHPSDTARQPPRELAPMPEEHLPRGVPRPLGPNICEIIPGGQHREVPAFPPSGTLVFDEDVSMPRSTAQDTLGGATAKDVARGLGHPGRGVSNTEARRDWEAHHGVRISVAEQTQPK